MGLGKKKILSQGAGGIAAADNFNTVIYSGNGNNRDIDVGFKPDLVWVKERSDSAGYWHYLFDSIRGGNKPIFSNATNAESVNDSNGYLSSFNNDGFSITSGSLGMASLNGSGKTYVAWNWKAGGAATDITSSSTGVSAASRSANPDAGFSIVTYTSNDDVVIPHGLNSAPSLAMVKRTDSTSYWFVFNSVASGAGRGFLNTGDAFDNSGVPTFGATDFTFQTNDPFSAGVSAVVYFFADVAGYQKIGTYTGSGSSGKFVSTGFEPRFLMIKATSFGNGYWFILDNQRTSGTNGKKALWANENYAEGGTAYDVRFDATGFTLLNTDSHLNQSYNYLYLAIA